MGGGKLIVEIQRLSKAVGSKEVRVKEVRMQEVRSTGVVGGRFHSLRTRDPTQYQEP